MRKFVILFLLACLSSLPMYAQQADEIGTATAIRALEHEWAEGQSRNDNGALDLIFDNALVYVEYGKLVSKGEYLLRVKASGPQISQIILEPMTVSIFGDTAVVVGTYREREVNGRKPGVRRWRFVDTWVYKKGGWALVAAGAAPVVAE